MEIVKLIFFWTYLYVLLQDPRENFECGGANSIMIALDNDTYLSRKTSVAKAHF